MDYKVTKSRLSNFLAYEWILVIVAIIAAIVLWEVVYSVSGVRLGKGQSFSYYYDYNLQGKNVTGFHTLIKEGEEDGVFSYDVLKVKYEQMVSNATEVLPIRLSNQEGDAIFTNIAVETGEDVAPNAYPSNRANQLADQYSTYSYDDLIKDAREYLKGFLISEGLDELTFSNLDPAKIETHFRTRMRGDNRFRKEDKIVEGIEKEFDRIENLCLQTKLLIGVMENHPEIFYRYHRYEQTYMTGSEDAKQYVEASYNAETEKVFALRLDKLTNGEKSVDAFFSVNGQTTAKDAVLMIFDYRQAQPDLQFETISFINMVIANFSDIM